MKKRTAWILVAGVAAVAIGAAGVGALALLLRGGSGSGGGAGSTLVLRLAGEIPELPPSSDLQSFFERRPASLRTLVESLDRAGHDPRVGGVLLRVSLLPDSGWAKVQELRDAVTRFRKSGKPAYAHLEYVANKEYYLATACNKIYAVPTGLVGVSGLEAEVTFFRNTLDKLGVEAQFVGIGKYKNAPNQFTEASFTAPHREQMEALIGSLDEQYVEAIARGRGKSVDEVRAIIDNGPYDAAEALKAGLVDELIYEDEVNARLKGGSRTTPGRYLRSARGLGFDSRPRVALVYAIGEIVPGESGPGGLSGDGTAGSETVAGALREARNDDTIKGVVLRVDSPGGFGPAADVIWREVALARRAKPVVVSMGDYAASGGYYVAMGGDAIVAEPGTITGSIGVFSGKFNLKGLYDKLGVTKEIVARGRHAALYSSYRAWTGEERQRIQQQMLAFYKDFVARAASGRKKTWDEVDAVAQGRVWTGAEAKRIGLVDELGGLDTAVDILKKKAGIPKDREIALVTLPERKGFFETFLERQQEEEVRIPADLRAMLDLGRILDGTPLARLPFDLRIR